MLITCRGRFFRVMRSHKHDSVGRADFTNDVDDESPTLGIEGGEGLVQ